MGGVEAGPSHGRHVGPGDLRVPAPREPHEHVLGRGRGAVRGASSRRALDGVEPEALGEVERAVLARVELLDGLLDRPRRPPVVHEQDDGAAARAVRDADAVGVAVCERVAQLLCTLLAGRAARRQDRQERAFLPVEVVRPWAWARVGLIARAGAVDDVDRAVAHPRLGPRVHDRAVEGVGGHHRRGAREVLGDLGAGVWHGTPPIACVWHAPGARLPHAAPGASSSSRRRGSGVEIPPPRRGW